MIEKINKISAIKIISETGTEGSSPLYVLCDDFKRYYVKTTSKDIPRRELINEIICSYFLKIWGLKVPKLADHTAEERHAVRLEEALPIINNLGKWMHRERNMVLPKSLIVKAIEYCTKLWSSLLTYLENGNYHIDNNAIENKIRPVAIDRKNYLFAGSHNGAKRTAMFYTFFANCKLNGVNPEK